MVGANAKLHVKQIMPEIFQKINDCKQLSASHTVIPLCARECFTAVCYDTFDAVLGLRQDSTDRGVRGIRVQRERAIDGRHGQDWRTCQCCLQRLEGRLCGIGPREPHARRQQSRERYGNSCIVFHEPAVVSGQTEPGTDIAHASRHGPLGNCSNLVGVSTDAAPGYDMSEERY